MDESIDHYGLALDVLANTPTVLSALLELLPWEVWSWSPAVGEWSPQEVLAHLLRVETDVIPVRVRHMVAEDSAPFASTAPTTSATSAHTPADMLADWQTARRENLAFLRSLTPTELARGGEHPHFGRISVREHIIEWAYHDLEHLRQIHATLEARLYPEIGGFRALYAAPYPLSEPSS